MNCSIASLLIGSKLLTFTCYATETGKTEDEKQAIEAIETLGGKFLSSHSDLNLSNSQITDAGMEHLNGLTGLTSLDIRNTQLTDAGLEHIKNLTELSFLELDNTKVTDAGLKHLKGLTKLSELNLNNTQITDAGLQELKTSLPKCQISNEGNETPERGRN